MKIEAFTEIKSMWQVRRVVLINGDCWLVDKLITSAGADDGDGDIDGLVMLMITMVIISYDS